MPLADAITRNIIVRKGDAAKKQADTAEANVLSSKLLTEELVHFPGDEAGFQLNWLGNAPFMQVQAGRDLFGQEGVRDTTRAWAHTANGRRRAEMLTGTYPYIVATTSSCIRSQQ
jgi:hypothetical protein